MDAYLPSTGGVVDGNVRINNSVITDQIKSLLPPDANETRIHILPKIEYTVFPTSSESAYAQALLKWIVVNYPNDGGIWFGEVRPSYQGFIIIFIYDTSLKNSNNFPSYSRMYYFPGSGVENAQETWTAGTKNYTWSFKYGLDKFPYVYVRNTFDNTSDINSTSISQGIYELNGFPITVSGSPTTLYGSFIQCAGTFKPQILVASGSSGEACNIYTRRYFSGASTWSDWKYSGDDKMVAFTPTSAVSTSVTIVRKHFMKSGSLVWIHLVLTLTSQLDSGTNLYTGFPAADATTDFVAVNYTNNYAKSAYITSGGTLKTGQAWPAGSYAINGCYYTTT